MRTYVESRMVGFVCWPLGLEVFLMMHFIISRKEVVMLEHFKCCLHVLLEINKLKNLRFTFLMSVSHSWWFAWLWYLGGDLFYFYFGPLLSWHLGVGNWLLFRYYSFMNCWQSSDSSIWCYFELPIPFFAITTVALLWLIVVFCLLAPIFCFIYLFIDK